MNIHRILFEPASDVLLISLLIPGEPQPYGLDLPFFFFLFWFMLSFLFFPFFFFFFLTIKAASE